MSNVKANLIKLNLKNGNHKLAVHIALMDSIEYDKVVNLSNAYAKVSSVIAPIEWRACLAALAKEGKYKAMSGEFNGQYGTLV